MALATPALSEKLGVGVVATDARKALHEFPQLWLMHSRLTPWSPKCSG